MKSLVKNVPVPFCHAVQFLLLVARELRRDLSAGLLEGFGNPPPGLVPDRLQFVSRATDNGLELFEFSRGELELMPQMFAHPFGQMTGMPLQKQVVHMPCARKNPRRQARQEDNHHGEAKSPFYAHCNAPASIAVSAIA